MTKDIEREMNNEVEERIKSAFETITPDIFPSILESLSEEKEKGKEMKDKRIFGNIRLKRGLAIAAAVCLVFAGGFGVNRYNLANAIESVITVDVNPSIEISVNAGEKVLGVNPLNDDAKLIVGDMDFKGSSLEVTLNALIGSMLRNGYISEAKNSILLSVDNTNKAKGEELKTKLTAEIDKILSREQVSGAIISTAIGGDSEVARLAEEYGITQGKAKLIKEITEKNERYSFKDLVSLSINELNLIAESPKIELTTVSKKGNASDSGYIGKKAALSAALKHAGLSSDRVYDIETEMDYEQGVMVYEIEFKSAGTEYEYDINANTGAIVKVKKDIDDDYRGNGTKSGSSAIYDDDEDEDEDDDDDRQGNSGISSGGNQSGNSASASYIGKDRAKSAAFTGAGVKAADVRELEIERDREKGVMIYEVSFRVGNTEYECKVDALTGKLLKVEKEIDEDDDDDEQDEDYDD